MKHILSLSLLLAACATGAPVIAPSSPAVAAKDPEPVKPPMNRAISIVQLTNKDVQCADLRRPGDTADSAICMMPGGAFIWLSASATALEVKQVADAPKPPAAPASSPPDVSTKPLTVTPTKGMKKP